MAENNKQKKYLSVVIPVYNEAANLEKLYQRLTTTLDKDGRPYEIIFTNDGSQDESTNILETLFNRRPNEIRVINLKKNFGQHMAIIAGFEIATGEVIATLDADLQNPPEEIPKLLEYVDKGYDLINGVRRERKDNWFRRYASQVINYIRAKITNIEMADHGSMLRIYSRKIIDLIVANGGASIYIPALAYSYASKPIDVIVEHEERAAGKSKYNLYKLIRLNFDLMTGYSLVPLQIFTLIGFTVALLSIVFVIYLFLRRIFLGPEVQGVFTLFAILFFLIGIILMGLGIVGEYIGRIYQEVRKKPRFVVDKILK
jgi:undecaprenyl-phosphate 4-deoxy-4-formamido-L-arabinose transferase